jgi:hypothetical protein
MGFSDKLKGLAKQAQDAVAEHKDQISEAVDRASVLADEKTHGKYSAKIIKANAKAGEAVEKMAAGAHAAGGEPATKPGASAEQTSPPAFDE